MGDRLVEQINQSILNMLRGLVDKGGDWEECLQHSFTNIEQPSMQQLTSLHNYEILFGFNPPPLNLQTATTVSHQDPYSYSSRLQEKLLELRELISGS